MKPVWVQLLHNSSKMLTFQLKASVPTAELPSSEMSFDWGQRGLGAPGCPTFRNFRFGAGGGQEALRQDQVERKYPVIQPQNSESACVVYLLQADDAAVAADAVQLCWDVKGFSGLAHQTKSKMRQIKDLIRAVLGILKQMIHAPVGCLTLKFVSGNDTWKNYYVNVRIYPDL